MEAKAKLIAALKDNADLLAKLEEAWKDNASDLSIKEMIAGSGIELDEEALQELLAMRQKFALDAITADELDEDQLSAVAGGGNGICDYKANCDDTFLHYPYILKNRRCSASYFCDELWHGWVKQDLIDANDAGARVRNWYPEQH